MRPPNGAAGQESEWIARARRRDQDAFESLVHTYEKRVYALTLRLCGSPEDAQEAAQEAFLSAWQGLPFFRGESSFSTWLYRLANNAAIDLLRREKHQRAAAGPSLDDEELGLDVPDPSQCPHDEAERAELRGQIEAGLQTLSPEHRTVLVLRELHELSYGEIAEALDLDVGTVKSRISRGRRQLQNYLMRQGNFFASTASKEAEKEGCK
jgi:RNA polymerase sigma-70 factor (ECF subfamily)